MKTKKRDKRYCGVEQSRIESTVPEYDIESLNLLMRFIKGRYLIHIRKDIKGLSAPWVKDKVLQNYRFTNVRREDDKVTRALIDLVSTNDELDLEEKVLNTFLFRSWNNPDTFVLFYGPWSKSSIYAPARLKEQSRIIYYNTIKNEPERRFWSAAYNQGGTKHAWKFPDGDGYQRAYSEEKAKKYPDWEKDIPLRVFHIGPWLKQKNTFQKLMSSNDQKEAFDTIKEIRGFADFLAYQVFVDLTYIEEFPFSENEFTIAGPGCKKGLDRLFVDKKGLTYEECLFWLRDNWETIQQDVKDKYRVDPEKLFRRLPEYDRCMNVMSLENCFCEFSKYIRTVKGEGRPKQRYDGGKYE